MIRRRSNKIGPHLLSPLEYDVYRLIEFRPRPTGVEQIRCAVPRSGGHGPENPAGEPRPPALLPEVERALGSLEDQGYVERILRGDAVELLRLTPWGKAVASYANYWFGQHLRGWLAKRSRGEVGDDSRPRRSAVVVELAPWEVGPSFDELYVHDLDLPARAVSALKYFGVSTVGQLVRMTEEELADVRNIGVKTVADVRTELRSVALDLAPSKAPAAGAGAAAPGKDRPEVVYPGWRDQPHLYQVFHRSKGLIGVDPESREERVLWRRLLMEMGYALDDWRSSTGLERQGERYVDLALDAFIRLVEPAWWRKHSPRELDEAELERLIGLLGEYEPSESPGGTFRQAAADGREATWRLLEGAVTAGVETFVRGRDAEGLERCARLVEVVARKD